MLHVHTSNQLEILLQTLGNLIQNNPLPPFKKEIIVVQKRGVEKWLSMGLAQHLGIWANGDFLFLDDWLRQTFKYVLEDLSEFSQLEHRQVWVWRLFKVLPKLLSHYSNSSPNHNSPCAELENYLYNDEQGIKQYQLATKLAEVFERYLVYRPTWIEDWEHGIQPEVLAGNVQAECQAHLWRKLIAEYSHSPEEYTHQHRVHFRKKFFEKLRLDNRLYAKFPRRISIFGMPALPIFYLEILANLAPFTEIHIFCLNASQTKYTVQNNSTVANTASLSSVTHPLLVALGKLSEDFRIMLQNYPQQFHSHFVSPVGNNMLACLQQDLLAGHLPKKSRFINESDRSLQFHICHSPMREVQVLHDQLLALFESNSSLLPNQVLVMVSDMTIYAPLIESVFTTVSESNQYIPFQIVDRSAQERNVLLKTFLKILQLRQSRFGVTEVLELLEVVPIRARFGLLEQDVPLIQYWIKAVNIRWGIDGQNRQYLSLPDFEENTWRAGLNRLLLGYALSQPLGEEELFQGILPFSELEGAETLILGRGINFIETLFYWVDLLKKSYSLEGWKQVLGQLLNALFEPVEDVDFKGQQQVQEVLQQLANQAKQAVLTEEVSCEVVQSYLRQRLEEIQSQSIYFLTGQVNFCDLSSVRGVPFEVICLLGMNDRSFPRVGRNLSFDLMQKFPVLGDDVQRYHDRHMFLELLLSARHCFYVSYVGRDVYDNTVRPPSVLISELLECMENTFDNVQGKLLNHLVIQHPLQPFSPRYFNSEIKELFSFSQMYYQAAKQVFSGPVRQSRAWLQNALELPNQIKQVSLDDLSRFFVNPSRFFAKERLGLELSRFEKPLDWQEPFEIEEGLEGYQFANQLVDRALRGQDLRQYYSLAKAAGHLPHGYIGEYQYRQLLEEMHPFICQVQNFLRQEKIAPYWVDLPVGNRQLVGHLGQLWGQQAVYYRYASVKAKDCIKIWLSHLVLNSVAGNSLPRKSVLIGKSEIREFQPLEHGLDLLEKLLLEYYFIGLTRPLPFFPEMSFNLANFLKEGIPLSKAIAKLQETWLGENQRNGYWHEGMDEYYRLCFNRQGEDPPFREDFVELAVGFFNPLLENSQPVAF